MDKIRQTDKQTDRRAGIVSGLIYKLHTMCLTH